MASTSNTSRRIMNSKRFSLSSDVGSRSIHGSPFHVTAAPNVSFNSSRLKSKRVAKSQFRRHYTAPSDPIAWLKARQKTSAQVDAKNPQSKASSDNSNLDFSSCRDPSLWEVECEGSQMHTDAKNVALSHPELEKLMVLDRHWLRDACACSLCVDPHSGQKNFGTVDVPTDLNIKDCRKSPAGDLEIVWQNDFLHPGNQNHISRYPAEMIQSYYSGIFPNNVKLPKQILWDKKIFREDNQAVDFNDWMAGGDNFLRGLSQLRTHGLLFLENVPKSEEAVITIASAIGNIQETFYGRTWDVRSKPQAENVAYTSSFLGLHQDLLYTQDPPRVQILHCLENTCQGGESIFSDALRAAHLMRLGPPHLFKSLVQRQVMYHYKKHGQHYQQARRVVNDNLQQIFWSPPFQSNDSRIVKTPAGSDAYRQWLRAATRFRELLEDDEWVYDYKMKPGQCVLFDNLRVVHGRKKFDATTGNRWLKGTYIANDVFFSKLATLNSQLTEIVNARLRTNPTDQAVHIMGTHDVWGPGKYEEAPRERYQRQR